MTDLAPPARSGWYPDPWQQAPWRWWDGVYWTANVSAPSATAAPRKPRLPTWLSVPVIVAACVVVPALIFITISYPPVLPLSLVPLVIVFPTLAWLDRVEPEPRSSRIHALLFGATVAALVSAIVNSMVASIASERVAAVVSAPIIEESMKALGIVWAVRRLEVDNVMDGLVYAGWVALGFAVCEDFIYLSQAGEPKSLVTIFVLRAILTPFAHPLFTAWTGLAIGRAIEKGRPIGTAVWGLALAIGCHMAWNGTLTAAEEWQKNSVIGVGALAFFILFVAAVVLCILARKRDRDRFVAAAPALAQRYGMAPGEVAVFGSWKQLRATRKQLPRQTRRTFDLLHASLARLSLIHGRPGPLNTVDEQRNVEALHRANTQLRSITSGSG
jgi:protease PrsW